MIAHLKPNAIIKLHKVIDVCVKTATEPGTCILVVKRFFSCAYFNVIQHTVGKFVGVVMNGRNDRPCNQPWQ